MLSWLKYVVVSIAVIGLVIFSGYMTTQHTANTRTVAEVDGAIKTALLGESRGQGIDSGISKEEFVSAVIASVVETQKNHGKTVKVDYVFLDSGGNATEVDESIKSIQYGITVLGKDGKVQSSAEKHLAIDSVGGSGGFGGNISDDTKSMTVVFEPGAKNRSKVVTVPGVGSIEGVEVDNGSVSYVESGNGQVTVTVGGGNSTKSLVSGELVPEHTKYVQGEKEKNYDVDGYTGILTDYTKGTLEEVNESKYVSNQPKESYEDVEGYKGKLEKYLHSGEIIPAASKYISAHTSSYYSDSLGYRGSLSQYVYSGSYTPSDTKFVTGHPTENYDEDGYKGKLTSYAAGSTGTGRWEDESGYHSYSNESGSMAYSWMVQCSYIGSPYPYECHRYRWVWESGGETIYAYEGDVTKPAKDTRVYRYRGTAVRPEEDTRLYRYQGEVTKTGGVGEGETLYRGFVTKPKQDTRVYADNYSYKVTVRYK